MDSGKEETQKKKSEIQKETSRPIFGSLGRVVGEDLSKHSLAAVNEGLKHMPFSESADPMHRYIENFHLQAIDLFDIYNERSIFNPHFIEDPKRRQTIEQIYHNAIDAKAIRDSILNAGEETKAVADETTLRDELPDSLPSQEEMESLQETIRLLSVRQQELERNRQKLQESSQNLRTCEELLDEIEKRAESSNDAQNIERVHSLLLQAQMANNLGEKAKEVQEDLKKRKRKGGDLSATVQNRKRQSFGTRYKQSTATIDKDALENFLGKLKGEE